MMRTAVMLLKAIRFDHTVFALPFALTAAFVASYGWPRGRTLTWILVAMVAARIAALAFDRIASLRSSRKAARTPERAPVTGDTNTRWLWALLLIAAATYFLAAAMLNRLCLVLSPLALALLLGYSYTKRLTVWTHWILGLCLGLAPVGAWIAVRARIDLPPLLLGAAVTFWAAGFDIIHACRTVRVDRANKLLSLPARWGARKALVFAAANHLITVWLLALFGQAAGLSWLYLLGVVVLVPALFWQHRMARPDNLPRMLGASFAANALFSVLLFLFTAADVILITSKMRI
jgi:4-hydroxybenzoate polyprenyltransferase